MQRREATRHLLRWEVTREAGARAVLTWAGILAAAVHADFLGAVDTAAVADTDNEARKLLPH